MQMLIVIIEYVSNACYVYSVNSELISRMTVPAKGTELGII